MTAYKIVYHRLFNRQVKARLPLILQHERAECGLACLTMISQYFGHKIDLQGMKQRFPTYVGVRGINLAQLIDLSQHLSLQTRAVKLPLEQLENLKVPAILHWDLDHFVVLKQFKGKKAIIHDPNRGCYVLSIQQISLHFTGVALEFSKAATFTPLIQQQKISLLKVVGGIEGWHRSLGIIFILSILLELVSLSSPFYLQFILDHVLVSANFELLNLLFVVFCIVAIVTPILAAFQMWSIAQMSAIIQIQWVTNIITHLFKLPLVWFEKRSVGDVISRIQTINTINATLSGNVISSLINGAMSLILIAVLWYYSSTMTIFLLLLIMGYTLFRFIYLRIFRYRQEALLNASAIQQSDILESIRGMLSIKVTNIQAQRARGYLNRAIENSNANLRLVRLEIIFKLVNRLLFGLGRVLLIWYATTLTLGNQLTPGQLVAYLAYSSLFIQSMVDFIDKIFQFLLLQLYVERLSDISLAEVEVSELFLADPILAPVTEYSLELKNIQFKYPSASTFLFNDFCLQVKSGEVIALVGASGCGKTTLVKIILGLLEPLKGEVYFAQQAIKQLGLKRYRDYIGCVMQQDQLFTGTIKQNICLFDEFPDDNAIIAVAKVVNIHDEIMQMTMNYDSLVGDMGDIFSGGQKQRLLLARALYRQPKLLILDEATSHLDLANEQIINKALTMLNITRIIIAHRPETIKLANRVIDLNVG